MINTHQKFLQSRINLQREFKVRNLISCLLIGYLGYLIYQMFPSNDSFYKIISLMAISSLCLSLSIFMIKIRIVYTTRKGNEELFSYIHHVIAKARLSGDYTDLNHLLDSKYSIHTILGMSRLPNNYYNFNHLQKWVKLPEAMDYFRSHNINFNDLSDSEKMRDYLKAVYPEFLQALADHRISHQS